MDNQRLVNDSKSENGQLPGMTLFRATAEGVRAKQKLFTYAQSGGWRQFPNYKILILPLKKKSTQRNCGTA